MKKVRPLFPTQNPPKKWWRREDPETDGKRDRLQNIMRNLFGVIDMFIILIMVRFQESIHISTYRHTYLYTQTPTENTMCTQYFNSFDRYILSEIVFRIMYLMILWSKWSYHIPFTKSLVIWRIISQRGKVKWLRRQYWENWFIILKIIKYLRLNADPSNNETTAAKSLQSCPTLCDPIDGSSSGSPSLRFSRQEHWSGS